MVTMEVMLDIVVGVILRGNMRMVITCKVFLEHIILVMVNADYVVSSSKQTSSSGLRLFPRGILQIGSNGDDQMVAKF